MMTKLCTQALEEGLETDYVRRFILKQKLPSPKGQRPPPDWPYPLRIHTLGKLEILINDKPLEWSRRSPERPLALLLALVAAGGTIDRERLLDLLWPDLESDKAYHALESTLYRLRNLLGLRRVIVSKGHRLHLERDQVFVDLWHLKERLEELERVSARGDLLKAFFLIQEILETYAEFLTGMEYPFVIFEREALKSRLFSLLKRLSKPLARAFPEQARFLLERIWLLDPTDEELFRPLFEFLAEESPETALDFFRRFATLVESCGKEVSSGLKERVRAIKEKASAP
jgi:DNA-binding SARP family transcriptional activator